MFDSDAYLHADDWSLRFSEILVVYWRMQDGDRMCVEIRHTTGRRYLNYGEPNDLQAIERLKVVMEYPFDLPSVNS